MLALKPTFLEKGLDSTGDLHSPTIIEGLNILLLFLDFRKLESTSIQHFYS